MISVEDAPAKNHAYEDRPAVCISVEEAPFGPQQLPATIYLYDDACTVVVMRFER